MKLWLAVTQDQWFKFVASKNLGGEINFWKPSCRRFLCLKAGEPFLFKMHDPDARIAGIAKFVRYEVMPTNEAWRIYGERNGYRDEYEFRSAVSHLQENFGGGGSSVGCIILDSFLKFPAGASLNAYDFGWNKNIVVGRTYTDDEEGLLSGIQQILPKGYLASAQAAAGGVNR
jgi:putative restriction endonuclease